MAKPLLKGASPAEDAYKLVNLVIPNIIGNIKMLAKRITPEGEKWPQEIRNFTLYLREVEQSIEETFPGLLK